MFSTEGFFDPNALAPLKRLEAASGKPIINKLAQVYLTEAPSHLEKMKRGIGSLDHELINRSAHSLKSSSGYLGAIGVRRLCERIEHLTVNVTALSSELEQIEILIEELRLTLEETFSEVKKLT